jgi:hemoglobin
MLFGPIKPLGFIMKKNAFFCLFFTAATLFSISACQEAQEPQEPVTTASIQEEQDTTSLYERLGGFYPIAAVVDDFIERLLVNETLNANPAIDEARASVPKAGLKYRVTELVGQVTGGPQAYTGRSMQESHAHLNITEQEWQAMMEDFKATLDHFEVPAQEQGELISILEGTKADIVKAGL